MWKCECVLVCFDALIVHTVLSVGAAPADGSSVFQKLRLCWFSTASTPSMPRPGNRATLPFFLHRANILFFPIVSYFPLLIPKGSFAFSLSVDGSER